MASAAVVTGVPSACSSAGIWLILATGVIRMSAVDARLAENDV